MTATVTARRIATQHIVNRAQNFPEFDGKPIDTGDLDPRDAALAQAIDHEVARRWLTLEHLLRGCISRPWENVETKLRAVLMAGAAQILLLDRVPDHAAVDEAVELARAFVRPGAAGFVNGVLRGLLKLRGEVTEGDDDQGIPLSDGRSVRLTRDDVLDSDPLVRLSQRTSVPMELLAHWLDTYDEPTMRAIAMHALVRAPLVVTGLPAPAEHTAAHDEPGFHVFTGTGAQLRDLLEETPGVRVQDPGSARAVGATAGLTPSVVIDVCAGRGTKTKQLAALHPNAEIIATDLDPGRAASLREAFDGHDRVRVIPFDRLREYAGRADLLVLDVPCTNTGVLARRVEARYRFGRESLDSLVAVQRQIIADTLPLLASGAHLLYATCSISPAENEHQWAWIRQWHPQITMITSHTLLPEGRPDGSPTRYRDGGAFALLSAPS